MNDNKCWACGYEPVTRYLCETCQEEEKEQNEIDRLMEELEEAMRMTFTTEQAINVEEFIKKYIRK